jgi:O-antigen ligase
VGAVAIAVASAGLGAALVALSWQTGRFGPAVLLAIALIPLLCVATFQAPTVGVAIVFATFPLGSLVTSLGPLPLQPVEAAVLAVTPIIGLRRLSQGLVPIAWNPLLLWALLLFGWTVVAVPSAFDKTLGFNQVLAIAAGILFATVVIDVCRDADSLRRMLAIFVGVAGAMAAFGLATMTDPEVMFGGASVSGRAEGAFNQPNQLGSFSAMGAMVAAGVAFAGRTKAGRVLAGTASFLLLAALTLSLSRGAWFGTFLGGCYLMAAVPRARRAIGIAAIPVILGVVAAVTFIPEAPQVEVVSARVQALTTGGPYDGRPQIWAEARREIVLDPWTGQGPGNFPVVSTRAGSEASTVYADHAHNLWLTWAAESGIPAALLISGFAVAIGINVRRSRRSLLRTGRRDEAALIAGLAAAGITVLGQGLVDYPLRNEVLWFTFWTVIGALLSSLAPARR